MGTAMFRCSESGSSWSLIPHNHKAREQWTEYKVNRHTDQPKTDLKMQILQIILITLAALTSDLLSYPIKIGSSAQNQGGNSNPHYSENPPNYPADKIKQLLQNSSILPGQFDNPSSAFSG